MQQKKPLTVWWRLFLFFIVYRFVLFRRFVIFYCFIGWLPFAFGRPAVLLIVLHTIHHLILRCVQILNLKEVQRELDFRTLFMLEERFVASLDGDTAIHVVPGTRMRHQQVVELPRIVFRVIIKHGVLRKARYSIHQVFLQLLAQRKKTGANAASATRAALALTGPPLSVAMVTVDQRVVNSCVIGIFEGGRNGHIALKANLNKLGGLNGAHDFGSVSFHLLYANGCQAVVHEGIRVVGNSNSARFARQFFFLLFHMKKSST